MELLAEQDTPSKLQVLSSKEEHRKMFYKELFGEDVTFRNGCVRLQRAPDLLLTQAYVKQMLGPKILTKERYDDLMHCVRNYKTCSIEQRKDMRQKLGSTIDLFFS
jgi:hypothetical protein